MGHTARVPPPLDEFTDLIQQIEALRDDIRRRASRHEEMLDALPNEHRDSARNLLHYLALRSRDLRPLQDRLAHLGLSSIGRAEPHVMATLEAVLHNLKSISGKQAGPAAAEIYDAFNEGARRLQDNTRQLLGPAPKNRRAHIMVTMPAEAADDYLLVHQLIRNGMDCIRINCSHDDPEAWSRMIRQKRYAERVSGRDCRVLMDLRGPKLRSGPLQPRPAVLKIRPVRDAYGKVTRPARIWLSASGAGNEAAAADAVLLVDAEWLADCKPGDKVLLRDARKAKRRWRIREAGSDGCWAEARKTTYLVDGTTLRLRGFERETVIRGLPERPGEIVLRAGDCVFLDAGETPGAAAYFGEDGDLLRPGTISLPIPEIYRDARPGETVHFDDGRICGLIEKQDRDRLQVRITHTRKRREKLVADKGVNFPDTKLGLPALSAEDLADLEFVAREADLVGLSFTNSADDVRELRERLLELGREDIGLVLKIETRRGFANLPGILLEALKFPACGVMIARGDLAVECGFERLAELQEEILWICESAHVPVIWATQVLEGLSKRGHASRAEVTDAAMSQSAECVMLNKGPFVIEAVRMLDDILQRMQNHQTKKRSLLRRLQLATDFNES
jgi:pyruvate kinase